jgi:hypothetical protein
MRVKCIIVTKVAENLKGIKKNSKESNEIFSERNRIREDQD